MIDAKWDYDINKPIPLISYLLSVLARIVPIRLAMV